MRLFSGLLPPLLSVLAPTCVAAMALALAAACGGDAPGAAVAATTCNGDARLCDRAYDAVSYVATHNAMSNADDGWAPPNQHHGLERQLADGVRTMLLDTQYPEAQPTVPYLCHGYCEAGKRPLVDALAALRRWLDANPREVLTLIFERYVSTDDTARAFEAAGLLPMVVTHAPQTPWPTLRQMLESGRRLVVFDQDEGGPDWYMPLWAHAQETPYDFKTAADFTCARNRGNPQTSLFLLNHFLANPFADPSFAAMVNPSSILRERALRCQGERGRLPNFVALDFYDLGDVFAVVKELNGL